MKTFQIFLAALALITIQVHAKDDGRNLVVKQSVSAGKRVALVIGNGNYQHSDNLPKLANPTHDAEDIAAALRGFGFEVIEKEDLSLEGMNSAIAEFSRKIGDSEAALFYFAGHGLQVKGQNYLVPINANIETEARVQYESINVNLILDEMDNGKSRANIVMLDACRNNPISGKFRSGATRGLAPISSQPKGTVIVYATDPGNVAADGSGRNGLFTAGLLTALKGNDLSLGGVLTRASEEVERGSEQKQTPYINGPATLQKNFHFAPGQATQIAGLVSGTASAQPATRVKTKEEIEQDAWESVRDSGNINSIQEYLKQYPKGQFVGQARILITTLKTTPTKPEPSIAPVVRADDENDLWTEAQKGNSKDEYEAYIRQYPKGKYVALANIRIKKLQDEAAAGANNKEQKILQQAQGNESPHTVQAYLPTNRLGSSGASAQMQRNVKTVAETTIFDRPSGQGRILTRVPAGVLLPVKGESTSRDGTWLLVSLPGYDVAYIFGMGVQEVYVEAKQSAQPSLIDRNKQAASAVKCPDCPAKIFETRNGQSVHFVVKAEANSDKVASLESKVQTQKSAMKKIQATLLYRLSGAPYFLQRPDILALAEKGELTDITPSSDGLSVQYTFELEATLEPH